MKVLSLFSGIGAFEKALKNSGTQYELVGFSEIDKYAANSYCAIHGVDESMNLGDITEIDEKTLPKDIDLVTYGFPCQDISLSGKQKGLFNEDGTQTRSGLFFEALRVIETSQPKVAIAENVRNLTSKKFSEQFEIVLKSLEQAGYNNHWQVLNSKDYGIPQNRERVFIVSIRKDIDDGGFKFPKGLPLKLRLRDMLEEDVDERYYMTEKMISYICATGTKNFHYEPEIDLEIARPLTSTVHKSHRASTDNYISDPFVKEGSKTIIKDGKPWVPGGPPVKIRKLTPKECFRLMGFDDEDFEKAEKENSNTQLYKQAGNSIVVPVLERIYEELFACGIYDRPNQTQHSRLKVLELFAGTRSIGKAFEARGHEVYSVDWDKNFEDIDLHTDISTLTAEYILERFGRPDVIWASPDCTTYSVAAISSHRRRNTETGSLDPVSEYATFCDLTNVHVLDLIEELKPAFWFIENPRGGMRKMRWTQDLPRYTVTYCQYGETRMKPTDIWTNHPAPDFKPPCKNGDPCHEAAPRGAQTGTQRLANSVEKAKIPTELCEHIVDICEDWAWII